MKIIFLSIHICLMHKKLCDGLWLGQQISLKTYKYIWNWFDSFICWIFFICFPVWIVFFFRWRYEYANCVCFFLLLLNCDITYADSNDRLICSTKTIQLSTFDFCWFYFWRKKNYIDGKLQEVWYSVKFMLWTLEDYDFVCFRVTWFFFLLLLLVCFFCMQRNVQEEVANMITLTWILQTNDVLLHLYKNINIQK